jgi:hypothetical protein
MQCNCDCWVTPAFQIVKSKVDIRVNVRACDTILIIASTNKQKQVTYFVLESLESAPKDAKYSSYIKVFIYK